MDGNNGDTLVVKNSEGEASIVSKTVSGENFILLAQDENGYGRTNGDT